MEDETGESRSNEDLVEALAAVEKTIVKDFIRVPPILGVVLIIIRDALLELLERREKEE